MTLVAVVALALFGVYIAAREWGFSKGYAAGVRDAERLRGMRGPSVVAREARKRCAGARNARWN